MSDTTMKVFIMKDSAGKPLGFLPARATPGAAGMDLRAAEDATVYCNQKARIATGIKLEIEPGFEGQVRSRSGLAAKHSCFVVNSPGTIDSDYRGEVVILLHNLGKVPLEVKRGDRIAQLVIAAVPQVEVLEVAQESEFSSTERGQGGFGSTGVS